MTLRWCQGSQGVALEVQSAVRAPVVAMDREFVPVCALPRSHDRPHDEKDRPKSGVQLSTTAW